MRNLNRIHITISAVIFIGFTIYSQQLKAQTLSLDLTKPVSCIGDSDAEVRATIDGGTPPFQFKLGLNDTFRPSLSGVDSVFVGLSAGEDTIYVRDAGVYTESEIIIIEDPQPISIGISGRLYECDGDGTGELIVTPSGGTANYDIDVSGGVDNDDDLELNATYSELSAASYTISVTDSKGCIATQVIQDIVNDVAPPTLSDFPLDYETTAAAYNTGHPSNAVVYQDITTQTFTGVTQYVNDIPLDLSNFSNARVRITASQVTTNPGWENTDSLSLRLSTNGGSIFSSLWIDRCVWNATFDDLGDGANRPGNATAVQTAYIDLGDATDFNPGVVLKLIVNIGLAGLQYRITEVRVIADQRLHTILPITSGLAPTCEDVGSGCDVNYLDSEPIWGCPTVGAEEFLIERTWTATDGCGKQTSQIQRLRVGTPPFFTNFPEDSTFDFCNLTPTIVAPTPNDACAITINPVTYSIVDLSDETVLATGDGTINPNPASPNVTYEAGEDYQITWSITDDVGFITTATQDINILDPISITINTIAADDHFCSGEPATFTITINGGTGDYDEPEILPTGLWSPIGASSGTYTTSGLTLDPDVVTISITVTDNSVVVPSAIEGGCTTDPPIEFTNNNDFTIHPLIVTPGISRD